jgi:hypothetical protein
MSVIFITVENDEIELYTLLQKAMIFLKAQINNHATLQHIFSNKILSFEFSRTFL